MTASPIRIGFIGVSPSGGGSGSSSWAAQAHIPYLQSDRNKNSYKITALQNSTKASAERAATAYKIENVAFYDNAKDIASDSDVDLVAVAIKVPGHYDAVMPALHAGKDVFVEWPLAQSLAEAEELTALAKQKGLKTLVGIQARQTPSILAAKRLVDAGELGDILGTTMHGYGMIFGATNSKDITYSFPVEAGANLLTIPAGHAIDALCYVLGEWEYVSATLANRRPKFSVTDGKGQVVGEDSKTAHDYIVVNGVLKKSGGVVSVIYEGGMNPSKGPSFFWQINGTKGTIVLEGPLGHVQIVQPTIKFGKVGEEMKDVEVHSVGEDPSYAVGEAWNAFAGKGDGHVTTFEDALVRHKMIDAIYRSNESGKRETYV